MVLYPLAIVLGLIKWIINLYALVLFIRVIIDWVLYFARGWRPGAVIGSIIRVFYALTDPPLRWLRRFIPPIRIGGMGLDITPVVLWFILMVLGVLI